MENKVLKGICEDIFFFIGKGFICYVVYVVILYWNWLNVGIILVSLRIYCLNVIGYLLWGYKNWKLIIVI